MNYFEAHKLLNKVKDGINHPAERITYALFLTGDLETPDGSSRMGSPLSSNEGRIRTSCSIGLVAGNDQRH